MRAERQKGLRGEEVGPCQGALAGECVAQSRACMRVGVGVGVGAWARGPVREGVRVLARELARGSAMLNVGARRVHACGWGGRHG